MSDTIPKAVNPARICAIILTKNEAQHIARCIESIIADVAHIIVVDSGSTDETVAIAKRLGAQVHFNPWVNYATQFNHGLGLIPADADWVLRIDADETLDAGWADKITSVLNQDGAIKGIAFRRYMRFRGKTIRHGGCVTWQLRLFEKRSGRCEARWMDEHITVTGAVANVPVALVDDNLNDLRWWTEKHIGYADREAVDLLLAQQANDNGHAPQSMVMQARVKRFVKNRIYKRLPTSLRAMLYFLLRYFVLLGFLDGAKGLQFHFLQGLWYRYYTDIRLNEIQSLRKSEGLALEEAIGRITGLSVGRS